MIRPGDEISVPTTSGCAVLKAIHVSSHFRDIVQFKLLRFVVREGSEEVPFRDRRYFWSTMPKQRLAVFSKSFKRSWAILGHGDVDDSAEDSTTRIVADEVWRLDKRLRRATPEDHASLPVMVVDGCIRLERILEGELQKLTSRG